MALKCALSILGTWIDMDHINTSNWMRNWVRNWMNKHFKTHRFSFCLFGMGPDPLSNPDLPPSSSPFFS